MAKNNNTLVFNGLMQGMSWDLIKEAKDEIQRHLGEKQLTRKDILTNWIIGKDYMLQLLGEYKKGGHLFYGESDSSIDNQEPYDYTQDEGYLDWMNGVFGNNNNNSSLNNITMGSGLFEGINSVAAPAVGGLANSFSYNDYWGNSSEVNKAAYGDSTADPIARLLGNISGTGLKRAKDEIENRRQGNVLNLNYGDNASLMAQIEAYNRSKAGLLSQLGDLTVGGGVTDFLNSTGLGALHGSTVLPGWGTLGGAILGSASWIGNALFENANKKKLNALILDANNDLIRNDLRIAYTANNNQLLNTFNQLQHMTKCGGKLKKSHKFAEGGLLNTYDYGLEEVNAGGSHEENPNEGVVVSYAPDGLPNKVEEGETIHNDYVYSKRLEANEKVLLNNLLDKKYEGKSFADISKKLTEDRKKRPNDPISVRTNEENLNRLQDALEELKLDNKTREIKRFLGSLNNDLLNALQLEMMDEYEAYAELLAQQLEQEDLAYQEEQAALEGMFGKGGHLFLQRGRLRRQYGLTNEIPEIYPWNSPNTGMGLYHIMTGSGETRHGLPYGNSPMDAYIDFYPVMTADFLYDSNYSTPESDSPVYSKSGKPIHVVKKGKKILSDEAKSNVKPLGKKGINQNAKSIYLEDSSPMNDYVLATNPLAITSNTTSVQKNKIGTTASSDNNPTAPKGTSYSSLAPLRFAEAFGSAGQYLSDILGLTNQPDYSNARMYQRAIDNIGGVNFTPIGDYLTYTPIDTEYLANQQMATAAARRNYGNIAGNYTLGLLGDYNTLNQIGATAIAARQQDEEQKHKVAEFNRTTNAKNSEMSLDAQKQNATLRALRALEYRYLADMMTKERVDNEAARAANYQTFMSNVAAVGREDYNYDFIRWAALNGLLKPGALKNYPGLFGYLS